MMSNSHSNSNDAEQFDTQTRSRLPEQVAETLRHAIRQGTYEVGTRLPSEPTLCKDFQVSRTCIREGLSMLVAEGLVERRHGVGTFVINRYPLTDEVNDLSSFSLMMRRRGLEPGTELLKMEWVTPPEDVAETLDIPRDTRVLLLRRLRYGDEQPICIQTSYLPPHVGRLLVRADMEQGGSLYQALERRGVVLAEGDVTIRAMSATPEHADLLQVAAGSPLLSVTATTYSDMRHPVEVSVVHYNADLYSYHARAKIRTLQDGA